MGRPGVQGCVLPDGDQNEPKKVPLPDGPQIWRSAVAGAVGRGAGSRAASAGGIPDSDAE